MPLPLDITAGLTTGHVDDHEEIHSALATEGIIARKPASADKVLYVSTLGNDANDGLSWGSAKLTIAGALSALAGNGGAVFVGAGTFTITAALSIPSSTRLSGVADTMTTIKVANATQINALVPAASGSSITIENLTIDCNKANQVDSTTDGNQTGLWCDGVTYLTLQNVVVRNSIREGFYPSNGGWHTYINCRAESCNRSGFEVDALQYTDIIGFKALSCSDRGIRVVGGASLAAATGPVSIVGGQAYGCAIGMEVLFARATQVHGFRSKDNTVDGTLINNSAEVGIHGCVGEGNDRNGLYILESSGVQVHGGNYRNNNNAGAEGADGIRLWDTVDSMIIGTRCDDTQGSKTQQYGINELNSSNRNAIALNSVRDNAQAAGLSKVGAATVLTANIT